MKMIKFKIYQCPVNTKYWGLNFNWVNNKYRIRRDDYVLVYQGLINSTPDLLEDIFVRFNLEYKKYFFYGRSLSVSDVVAIQDGEEWKYYYCDGTGWSQLKHFANYYLDNDN